MEWGNGVGGWDIISNPKQLVQIFPPFPKELQYVLLKRKRELKGCLENIRFLFCFFVGDGFPKLRYNSVCTVKGTLIIQNASNAET